MFSIDALIMAYLPILGNIIMANKFTILAVFYTLDKLAKYTDTTVDDKIVTFLKNLIFKIIGRGSIVDAKFEYFKSQHLLDKPDPLVLKKASEQFDQSIKKDMVISDEKMLPIIAAKIPMPDVKPPKEDKEYHENTNT